MRKFVAFFLRIRAFLFFLFLQICAFSFYITFMSFPKNSFLTSSNYFVGTIYSWQNSITKYLHLDENNTNLQNENALLRKHRKESLYKISNDTIQINDTLYRQQFTYIPADIVNSTVNRRNNFFTLNVGKNQGVKQYMGVISPQGIVGQIHAVSEHYSVVKSVLSEKINVSVLIRYPYSETEIRDAYLNWDGKSPKTGNVTGVSSDFEIPKGSKVYTQGGAGIFPKGIFIGTFKKQKTIEGEPLLNIEIDYKEDYRVLQKAYVVKNLFFDEFKELENKKSNDE